MGTSKISVNYRKTVLTPVGEGVILGGNVEGFHFGVPPWSSFLTIIFFFCSDEFCYWKIPKNRSYPPQSPNTRNNVLNTPPLTTTHLWSTAQWHVSLMHLIRTSVNHVRAPAFLYPLKAINRGYGNQQPPPPQRVVSFLFGPTFIHKRAITINIHFIGPST